MLPHQASIFHSEIITENTTITITTAKRFHRFSDNFDYAAYFFRK